MKKRLIGFLLLLAMLIGAFAPVARADGDQLSEEERKKQEAESQAARISGLRDDLLLELSAKRGEADALMDDMISLDGQIAAVRANIDRILQERVEQEADLEQQKASMAMRIQFAYEQSPSTYLELLLGSRSLSEILNNAEYIRSISEYDEQRKEEFEKALSESEEKLNEMRSEEERLSSLLSDTASKLDDYQQITDDLLKKIDEYNREAEAYSAEAAALDQEIAEIAERLKREEEAARKAAEIARRQKEEEEEARRQAESISAEEESRRREEESRAAETTAAPTETPETLPVPTETAAPTDETQPPETEAPPTQPPETQPPETEPPETEPPETQPPETEPPETQPPETEPPETEPPETEPPETGPSEEPTEPPETEPMSEWQRRYLYASDERGVGTLEIDPTWLNPSGYTNLEFLAAIIDVEGGGQPYEGQIAIGNIIMNRILEPGFQMTIYDVVFGPGQFPPATNGMLALCLARGARESCVNAARDVLNGVCTIERKWLYFCSLTSWDIKQPRHTEFMQIGTHIFYY